MKQLILLGLGITLVTFQPALAARDEGKCKEIGDEITKAKKDYEAAKPKGVDGLEGGADRNNEDMGQGKRNGGRGAGASAACVKRMTPINKKFKKLKDDAKTAECGKDKEEKDAEDGETESQGAIDSCNAAQKANEGQKDKNGGNEKKMGDDKKDEKGGGGSPPQMPQIPEKKEKKEEKKEDPAVKEAERQAKIAQCKVQVQMNLEVKKANCEKDIPFNPQYPVFDQKKKQDECKQNAIFASQAEMNMCESKYPPTIPGANSTISGNGGNTTPPTNTNTSTNTNTNTK